MMDTVKGVHENHAPIPLDDLRQIISSKTYSWLKDAEEKEAELEADFLRDEAASSAALFVKFGHNDEDGEGNEYEDERVLEWTSSSFNDDGYGGYINCNAVESENNFEEGVLRVKYIFSDATGGHGNDLWAASRYISNVFTDVTKCYDLLKPCLSRKVRDGATSGHPLVGLSFVELGAGAGLPSWTALQLGARVVCTDQAIPNRIRCMAECAERNLRVTKENSDEERQKLVHAEMVRVCPYDWGTPVDEVTEALQGNSNSEKEILFDIVVAADCIYMPHFHSLLLDSIKSLMSKEGMALLPFALHGNTNDRNVWNIVDLAKEKGFCVDVLDSHQLTPQSEGMESKRALVHTLRLTWT